jgi:hypothetical protein
MDTISPRNLQRKSLCDSTIDDGKSPLLINDKFSYPPQCNIQAPLHQNSHSSHRKKKDAQGWGQTRFKMSRKPKVYQKQMEHLCKSPQAAVNKIHFHHKSELPANLSTPPLSSLFSPALVSQAQEEKDPDHP